jgi:hypothetical protein
MSNSLLTMTKVTREAMRILHQKLSFIKTINRQYDDSYAKSGAKIGDSLKIRLPNQYTVRTGKTINTQDTSESSVTLTMGTQKGVDLNFSTKELTLDIDDFGKRILDPAMSVLAANIEADVLQDVTKDVYNLVGTAGTTPATMLTFGQARQKLNQYLAPQDKRRRVQVDSETMVTMVDAYKGLFQNNKAISDQYIDGFIDHQGGFDWYENESILSHTTGTRDNTTPLTNDATAQTGSSLVVDGLDASVTIKRGDVFTIAGVFAVHPETKTQYSHLQQFVVTADATANGSGEVTLSISPSIVASGATQNVSNGAADDKAITFVGAASTTYGQNLAYHEDAFAFVTADLLLPGGVDMAAREVYDGISMRIVRAYDINNDNMPCRIDVLYGYETLRAQLACRITK